MSRTEHIRRFETALRSENAAEEIPRLAVLLRDEGVSQIELYVLFERFQLATSGEDPRYDAIVDTMDLIVGGPWAKGGDLYREKLTEQQINEHRKQP